MGLKVQLADSLPAEVVPYVSDHVEVIGTIAILDMDARLIPYVVDYALDALLPLLAKGGMAHVYLFKTKEQVPALIAGYER